MPPTHIAVLGGGITGLSSAFHLSRRFPSSLITLVEKQPRLGGWIRSERVTVSPPPSPSSSVVLEAGPRTLRPVDKSLLELINLLGLAPDLVTTSKSSPAAKSRFLHAPELTHGRGILPIPSSLLSLFSPFSPSWPLAKILLPAVLCEPFRKANRPTTNSVADGYTDESVEAFLTRRFGAEFARTFGSALVHGIYATDSRTLSVKAAFPMLWDAETGGGGSVLMGFLKKMRRRERGKDREEQYETGGLLERMKDVSVYSFRDGMETLPRALEKHLSQRDNVKIVKGVGVAGIRAEQGDDKFEVTLDKSIPPLTATHIVCALPPPILHNILNSSSTSPLHEPQHSILGHLTSNPTSTVTVINLVFPYPPSQIHPPGFGYLIPRPPASNAVNDSGLHFLGTVFDSCSLSAQDYPPIFTKLTVMLKGDCSQQPETRLIEQVLTQLSEHLTAPSSPVGRRLPDPALWRIHVNRDCIPTYTPGHRARMEELRRVLRIRWQGRLDVVGAGVDGVSVGDCVQAGRRAGKEWL
ncbi:hypothetical protein AX17_004660 [Amanita inopinata Kibby_2008]|nr:hypothetical protein AX17_004660 [Amanita inopinata Kibby_2008]